jgi:23S rRNA (cytosine1962-C5)-methyltransferase
LPHAARAARPTLRLAPGRERSLLLRHPWIFSGAIEAVDGAPATGDTVDVVASDGRFLGRGAYSPSSRIRARIWSFDPATAIDAAFFAARVERAIAARAPLVDARHDACRLVHGESDGLPGVVADRYADTVVVQLTSAGAERWRDAIIDALAAATGARCVFERSDAEVRALEGLTARTGAVRGRCNDIVDIVEAGIAYRVDVAHGQKTGFYLDQRDNRALVCRHARDRRVLNAFCYTGGFTLAALVGGASRVLSIDSSAEALALARENLGRNPALDAARAAWREADVFEELRALRNRGAAFDLVVLDPPKFAPTAAHAQRAARAYKDINLLAFKLLAPGGLLATFSCSGGVGADLFRKIVAGAARDAGVEAAVIARMSASADHPVALGFPEGEYLKGLLIRKSA